MRLTELEPQFLKRSGNVHEYVSIADADGIFFLCPACFAANKGNVGTHGIICWQPHVPQTESPGPGRWSFQGTGYEDLTLVAGSSSILLNGAPCKAHFYVRNGEIVLST
jgi:hypothetical protein